MSVHKRKRPKPNWMIVPAVVLWLAICLASLGQAASLGELESLRHLKGVAVAVEKINPEVEKLGLKGDQIKAEVEARLQKAGIKKITEKDAFTGNPWLYININAFEAMDGRLLIYAISVELIQNVRLVRAPLTSTSAVTWAVSQAGYTNRLQVDALQKVVDELIDRFIQNYSQANQD
jgi:hypothetical protein